MNTEKWDAIAKAFAVGTWVPANGLEAWYAQAVSEATTIRSALPLDVETLLEVGCGVGRLTPYLALLFPRVIATDTSPVCRRVTAERCEHRPNVVVAEPVGQTADAALVWGNLYDSDWTLQQISAHRQEMRRLYPLVLEGNSERWKLWDPRGYANFEA